MHSEFFPYEEIPQFSSRDKAYQRSDKNLRSFYHYDFEYDSLYEAIKDRNSFSVDRQMLVQELLRQYKTIERNDSVLANIELLKSENTYTIITAHQPSLLTGPLYYILKICSAINLAKKLTETSDKNIVPVFILGAEDHDFDEINHLSLYDKKIAWDRSASGSVGRLSMEGIDKVIEQVRGILGDSVNAKELLSFMAFAQKDSITYGDFMFKFTHALFHHYGLIVANFDNVAFKRAFIPLIKKEVLNQFSKPLVSKTQEEIKVAGFSDQAYVRDINFFYLDRNGRNRIEKKEGTYYIVDTDIQFSQAEMTKEIEENPDRFSPNVIMRPLFQELILPNLAYIGGGGELAYWMERKSQFSAANVFFPLLIRRNSAVFITGRIQKTLDKLGLVFQDLLTDTDQLLKRYALEQSEHTVDFQEQITALDTIYTPVSLLAEAIDPSLIGRIEALKTQAGKDIDKIQTRLIRSIKQQQEIKLNKIRKTKNVLFPSDSLQERKANFMEFYLLYGKSMLEYLVEVCDPFEKRFLVINED